ncbi:MAG: sugar phosphate isomerase/epimerase [Oscillospiraceae bacterium]|nr:sugar phosphate isomerase/epimerase [Oscillospiraceae bacterium]
MKQLLIIPDRNNLADSLEIAEKYSLGFEYNDFFVPKVLDSKQTLDGIVAEYKSVKLPEYCTMHGAFFDVIPFSFDERIKEISDLRIEQSIAAAEKIGAKAVVFHTNYNPFLNSEAYINSFVETNAAYWDGVLKRHKSVSVYLENMFDTTPDIMVRLSERLCVNDNFGICLDYAHAALSAVQPKLWAKALGGYIKHVHINDNDCVSDLHLAWGVGRIDTAEFYRCYEKYMNGATVLVETNAKENILASLKRLKADGFI